MRLDLSATQSWLKTHNFETGSQRAEIWTRPGRHGYSWNQTISKPVMHGVILKASRRHCSTSYTEHKGLNSFICKTALLTGPFGSCFQLCESFLKRFICKNHLMNCVRCVPEPCMPLTERENTGISCHRSGGDRFFAGVSVRWAGFYAQSWFYRSQTFQAIIPK